MGDGKVHFLYERGYHFRRMGDVSAEWTTFAEWTTVHSAEAVFDYHGPFSGRMGDFGRRMDDFPAEWTTFPAEWATIRRMGDAPNGRRYKKRATNYLEAPKTNFVGICDFHASSSFGAKVMLPFDT